MQRIVITGSGGGHLSIEYLGAVGLRGGRYRVHTVGEVTSSVARMTTDLANLRILRDLLTHEIDRAAQGGV